MNVGRTIKVELSEEEVKDIIAQAISTENDMSYGNARVEIDIGSEIRGIGPMEYENPVLRKVTVIYEA